MKHIALLLAGGKGNRMNASLPKQYMEVDGESVILHTMRAFQTHPLVTDIYVVCAHEWEVEVENQAREAHVSKFRCTIKGGDTSFESIQLGIKAIASKEDDKESIVLVHDAVRPLITQDVISRNIAVCLTYGNAITALSSQEAFMRTADGVSSTDYVPRHELFRAQTPHTFPLQQLVTMMREADERHISNSQSLYTLANELGHTPLYMAQGDALNFKITVPSDILMYQALKAIAES